MANTHYGTPTRAGLRTLVAFLEEHDLVGRGQKTLPRFSKKAIFDWYGIKSRTQGYDILNGRDPPSPIPRRTRNQTR